MSGRLDKTLLGIFYWALFWTEQLLYKEKQTLLWSWITNVSLDSFLLYISTYLHIYIYLHINRINLVPKAKKTLCKNLQIVLFKRAGYIMNVLRFFEEDILKVWLYHYMGKKFVFLLKILWETLEILVKHSPV